MCIYNIFKKRKDNKAEWDKLNSYQQFKEFLRWCEEVEQLDAAGQFCDRADHEDKMNGIGREEDNEDTNIPCLISRSHRESKTSPLQNGADPWSPNRRMSFVQFLECHKDEAMPNKGSAHKPGACILTLEEKAQVTQTWHAASNQSSTTS